MRYNVFYCFIFRESIVKNLAGSGFQIIGVQYWPRCCFNKKLLSSFLGNFYRFYFFGPIGDDESNHSFAWCSSFHLPVIGHGFSLSSNPFPFLTNEITFKLKFSDYCNQCYRGKSGCCHSHIDGQIYCAAR